MEYVDHCEPPEPGGRHEAATSTQSRDNALRDEQVARACQGLGAGRPLDQVCDELGLTPSTLVHRLTQQLQQLETLQLSVAPSTRHSTDADRMAMAHFVY
ncbi:hypothetical protein JN531_005025 [Flagellatimonas centrodinii]|uniref:hypothetical protein n=1 Tax=Flagellatimonas centrodinii TaxID=2806210 RepID=UPI001FEE501D|nr:hypothetical protein [Flagellatimonas centrodinii]ULQ47651.1 hypothetical protein JN531_005025 [Flagellatimonas centrodinii]